MKEKNIPTCPGCRKHCPLSAVRCKYGRNYIEKLNAEEDKPRKWKKRIAPEGELHLLLSTAKGIKSALKESAVTESQLLSTPDPFQREALSEILKKLSENLPETVLKPSK